MFKAALLVALAVLAPLNLACAAPIFEDDFNRALLGSDWAVSGAGSTATINGSEQLELEGAGPVYYDTTINTGVNNSSYTIEYTLASLSDQTSGNYIGIVSFGDNLAGDRVQANYVTNGTSVHTLYLQVYDNGVRVENYPTSVGVNLRQHTSHIVYEVATDGVGVSTVTFSAYEDATKTNLLFQMTPKVLTTAVGAGYVGFSLPSDAYEGYSIDNFALSSGAIPEPASMMLLAAGGLAVLSKRNRECR